MIKVNARFRWNNRRCHPEHFEASGAICAQWQSFFARAIHIAKLSLGGYSGESLGFVKMAIEHTAFPKLEELELKVATTLLRYEEERFPGVQATYSADALAKFLLRHSSTLKAVALNSASGVESGDNKPSAISFASLLETIRCSLTHLESAKIKETQHYFYQEDAEPNWSEDMPFGQFRR